MGGMGRRREKGKGKRKGKREKKDVGVRGEEKKRTSSITTELPLMTCAAHTGNN